MKRFAAAALFACLVALPVCAQHGAAHGGFSGRSAPAFHGGQAFRGGPAAPAPNRYAGFRGNSTSRPYGSPYGNRRPTAGIRRPYTGNENFHHRRAYISPYGVLGYGIAGYAAPGWIGPGYLGYSDDNGSADTQPQPPPPSDAYDQQPDQQEPPPWPLGGASVAAANSAEASRQAEPPAPEDAVTLIFKDGRPPEQIHNYIVTRGTLYIGDQHRREVPVDDIDLTATAKVNRDAGVDFHIPTGSR